MKTERRQLRLAIFIPMLLFLNCIVLLLICFIKGQFQTDTFLRYMYYASFVNIAMGAMSLIGNIQSREANLGVTYNVYPRKTNDEMFSEEMKNRNKSLTFTIGLVAVGVMLLALSMLLK